MSSYCGGSYEGGGSCSVYGGGYITGGPCGNRSPVTVMKTGYKFLMICSVDTIPKNTWNILGIYK